MGAIVDRRDLPDLVAKLRREGKRIAFTNGCFDLLHIGHVRYLAEARAHGDVLIVGLNSDASVLRLKGPKRPIVSEGERAEMLAGLASVDYVVVFEEDTPDEIIRIVRPKVHVKGGDRTPDDIPEAPLVRSLGGEVVIAEQVNGRSTTITIGRILERHAEWLGEEADG
jgi:rfaE bifunctional protein nucleotidyltransferase chain/domain